MSYNYETEKPKILTDDGQQKFIKVRDRALKILDESGAADMSHLMSEGGDSWTQIAFVDRMVELGDIKEIDYGKCAGQDRIFIKAGR